MKKVLVYLIIFWVSIAHATTTEYFKGIIAHKLQVWVKIEHEGDSLTGKYFYTKQGKEITVRGAISNGAYILHEYNDSGKVTGQWNFSAKGSKQYAGSWQVPGMRRRPMPLLLTSVPVAKQIIRNNKPIKIIQGHAGNESGAGSVGISYPLISDIKDNYTLALFNAMMQSGAEREAKDFSGSFTDGDGQKKDEAQSGAYETIECSIENATTPLLSFSYHQYAFLGGGHAGGESIYAQTFSTTKSRFILVKELFKRGSPFVKRLSDYCINKLKDTVYQDWWNGADFSKDSINRVEYAKAASLNWLEEQVGEKEKNFEAFIIQKKGIRFLFGANHEVFVPYVDIEDILDKEGDLKYLLKK